MLAVVGFVTYLEWMSRAFTKDDDTELALADIGERPVSEARNLVTQEGLDHIDRMLTQFREEFARAEGSQEREQMALAARDLRYWQSRRESAELSVPEPDEKVVRFGMTVNLEGEAGKTASWKIVGEDEADATAGKISHSSPMAQALFGKTVGDVAVVNGKEWEIAALSAK